MSIFGPPNIEKLEAKKDIQGLIKALDYRAKGRKEPSYLSEESFPMRRRAVEALGRLGDPRAIEPIIKAAVDADYNMRRSVEEALVKIGSSAVEPLIKVLGGTDYHMYSSAACALGKIGDARAVEPLIKALGDTDRRVRMPAANALGKPRNPRTIAADALGEIGDPHAIKPLIEHFRKTGDSSAVSNALAGIGTIAVIEPLLEIFRTVKPSSIQEDGSVAEGKKEEDGAPANALMKIPGAIERLKLICSPDEFERILLRAHDYGDSSNPNLNEAFGEIASPKAFGRLLFVLGQHHWGKKDRRPAREALVKAGKQAHPYLLEALKRDIPNRDYQLSLRREILEALKVSGNDDCLTTIKAVMKSDPAVAHEASAAIEAISNRRLGIVATAEPELATPNPEEGVSSSKNGIAREKRSFVPNMGRRQKCIEQIKALIAQKAQVDFPDYSFRVDTIGFEPPDELKEFGELAVRYGWGKNPEIIAILQKLEDHADVDTTTFRIVVRFESIGQEPRAFYRHGDLKGKEIVWRSVENAHEDWGYTPWIYDGYKMDSLRFP